MNVADQRRSKRFELRLPFELVREGARSTQGSGETMNLSSVGVLFTSPMELEVGSPIEYYITLQPRSEEKDLVRLHCVGKIVRRHEEAFQENSSDVINMAATLERYEFVRQ